MISVMSYTTLWTLLYLYSGLGKIKSECELLPSEDVWVLSLLKCSLQLMELEGCEGCPGSSHLPWSVFSIAQALVLNIAPSCQEFTLVRALPSVFYF